MRYCRKLFTFTFGVRTSVNIYSQMMGLVPYLLSCRKEHHPALKDIQADTFELCVYPLIAHLYCDTNLTRLNILTP